MTLDNFERLDKGDTIRWMGDDEHKGKVSEITAVRGSMDRPWYLVDHGDGRTGAAAQAHLWEPVYVKAGTYQ